MRIDKKIITLGFGFIICSQFSLAQEIQGVQEVNSPVAVAFQNVQNQPIAINPNEPIPISNGVEESGGFKDTLMNKVDEKMAKIDELERKINEQQLQNQLNQSNINIGGGDSSNMSNLSVPVVVGTTIIEKGKKTLSKEVLAVDSSGNKFTLNEKNNNVIKSINSDYIVFKDSKDKFPILISSAFTDGVEGANGGVIGTVATGFPNSMLEVPNSIKAKADNSLPVGSLQDNNISNSLK